ncbi:MAG: large subunit ribosomal protein L10 [Candidatus Tokpelaia sp. JSC188]|nr:MAG: large subunit ribosomal protein L10 [Candidatus Tokpelaia sp. JSC188]
MDKAKKREFVIWLNEIFKKSSSVVVAHYSGLTVAQMNDLRSKMRAVGASVKVVKNRLTKIALQGMEIEETSALFNGQTLIAYSSDPLAAPKVATDFSRVNDKFIILGGTMGAVNLDVAGVRFLASIPSLKELHARIVGIIFTPATRIAQVTAGPASQLVRILDVYARKNEAG